MHHKKSEAQIGKESSGTSSDFHPRPSPLFLHQPHQHHHNQPNQHRNHRFPPTHNPTAAAAPPSYNPNGPPLPSTPHKRPVMTAPAAAGSTLPLRSRAAPAAAATATAAAVPAEPDSQVPRLLRFRIPCSAATKAAVGHLLRRLRVRVRLLLLISFPSIYLLLTAGGATSGKGGGRSLLFDFLSALAFSSALLLLLAIYFNVIPLSSLRLIFTRSSSFLLPRHFVHRHLRRQSPPPVLWSIGDPGEKQKTDKNRPSSGLWVQVYSNGDVYEGEFHRGKCTGSGVYHYYMSGRYEGDWVDDKYDGYGVETWARGSRYRGQYRQGLRHGFGIYRFYTGDVYAGEWSNGQSHGSGVHTCEDGSRYVGEFKWGVKHGLGHYHFRNGDTYSGEYFADKMHGFGIYRFANGHRYEGAWHEGKRQGLGMYTFRNGDTQSGHWQNGVLNTLSTQNILPGSSVAVNHSKVLNAIQEARRAAERAFDIPRVDDRVNKAVAAANKAANAARVAAVKAVQKRMPNKSDDIPIPIV